MSYLPVLIAPKPVNIDAQLIMPLFEKYGSLSGYFNYLFTFRTYDLQPVRDLTLYFDFLSFKYFGLTTFVLQNAIYWFISCLVIEKLVHLTHPLIDKLKVFLLTLLFAAYPLFCSSISHGISRKHVLSFLFIVLATLYFLKFIETGRRSKHAVLFSVYYVLAIFSQPIALLWPVWASLYLFLKKREGQLYLIPSYIFLGVTAYANYLYYAQSATFKLYFESKTEDAFNVPDKILGIGHYFFQLFFPYRPATAYALGHWSVLVGLVLFGTYLLVYLKLRRDRIQLLIWGSFTFFPICTVLANPHILSDNYLLIPALGLFLLSLEYVTKLPLNFKTFVVPVSAVLIFFVCITFYESTLWTNPIAFAQERNFNRRSNCDSALTTASRSFNLLGTLDPKVSQYLEEYDCFNPLLKTPGSAASLLYTQVYLLYFNKELSLDRRIEVLQKLATYNFHARLALATLLYDNGRDEEAREQIETVWVKRDLIQWTEYYEFFIATKLYPHCQAKKNEHCLLLTERFTRHPHRNY